MNTTKKSIMLIGEKETFLIRVLLKKLTEADLDAFFVSSSIDEIQLSWPNASILTYYQYSGLGLAAFFAGLVIGNG